MGGVKKLWTFFGAQGHFIAVRGVSLIKCPKCLNATYVKSSLSRDEDGREEEEDVIDAMLNSGRGTGKFEGPGLGW